jgi:FtsZ-binding cell division protein ZapB
MMKIEASVGEAVDKITILGIKLERIKDPEKSARVKLEYDLLKEALEREHANIDEEDVTELRAVNSRLWDIEDRLRVKHRDGEFDDEFVELAKSVYLENDKRYEIKSRINRKAGARIVEEKEYADHGEPDGR